MLPYSFPLREKRHLLMADDYHSQSLGFLAALPEQCLVFISVAECSHWAWRAQGRWRPLLCYPAQIAVPHDVAIARVLSTAHDTPRLTALRLATGYCRTQLICSSPHRVRRGIGVPLAACLGTGVRGRAAAMARASTTRSFRSLMTACI